MQIIIVGDGKVGVALTERLSLEGHDITVIDSNPKVLEQSAELFDVMVVQGNGASMQTLRDAGVEYADLLIAATSRDEINLLTCIMARKLGTPHTIARVRNPEYAEQLVAMKDELGLSMTINPELAAAREVYHLLQFPSFLKRDSFAKGRVEIVEIRVTPGSRLAGIPLSKLYEIAKVKVLVCAVERGNEVHIPTGRFTLQEGDNISVTADTQDLADLIKHLGLVKHKIKNLIIVGGSRIAFYLALRCLRGGIGVKIIEQNPERCAQLAELLPQAVIIEADGSRQDILAAEGINQTDALVTLTNMDEENIIISMYANHVGVPKVITKINRIEYLEVFKNIGIDTVISPKVLCCTDIVRYVRAMQNTSGGSAIALHHIVENKAEALEFCATASTRHLGQSLTDMRLKEGILIACITRRGKTRIPKGDSYFEVGDTVIVVTTSDHAISDLNDIFAD